ncbi:hypothetical protein ACIF8T_40210 [Streptomyces sp. NPDC085946]|uniref:hypothetical protein n=1 Tax=Streptomyces sp. NPDC085946 TaxID=3365744 RepID=UPI0037D8C133
MSTQCRWSAPRPNLPRRRTQCSQPALQSANSVLRDLKDTDLITQATSTDHGRALPIHPTETGRQRLHTARDAVHAIEARMINNIPAHRLATLLADLDAMTQALGT